MVVVLPAKDPSRYINVRVKTETHRIAQRIAREKNMKVIDVYDKAIRLLDRIKEMV